MQFDLLRVTLIERPRDLFDYDLELETREQWLRKVFASETNFPHQKQPFVYVPDHDAMAASPDLIVGRIGRRKVGKENQPPEHGLREIQREAWHALRIILDPTHHKDGQKLAVERDTSVATGLAVVASLAKQINRSPHRYLIEVEAISETKSFWGFVEEHPTITSVTFEFLAPNMFGIEDDFDADVRDLKAEENSDKTRLQLTSKDGVNTKTGRVKKLVDWVGQGRGRLKAKAKDRHRYDSDDSIKSVNLPEAEKNISWNDLAKLVVRRIFKV